MEEAAEQPDGLQDGELFGELGLLKLDSEALAQLRGIGVPAHSQHFDLAGIGGGESLADFHGGGLSGAVGSEQPETFAGTDLEIQAVDGEHILVSLAQIADLQGGSPRYGSHMLSIASGWLDRQRRVSVLQGGAARDGPPR